MTKVAWQLKKYWLKTLWMYSWIELFIAIQCKLWIKTNDHWSEFNWKKYFIILSLALLAYQWNVKNGQFEWKQNDPMEAFRKAREKKYERKRQNCEKKAKK